MKSVLIFIAVVCSVSALPSGRINEGTLAEPGNYPYVVSITENDRHICGGFIYSARWIVTAASCVEGKTPSTLRVVAGQVSAINLDPNEQTVSVYTVTIFPQYDSDLKLNDIALLKLTADINMDGENVDFVGYNEAVNGVDAEIMGWGATFEGGFESVNLRYATAFINVKGAGDLCGTFDTTAFNFATMICASTVADPPPARAVGSPCKYDEGSPLVQKLGTDSVATVVGILSKSDDCSLDTAVSVYTRVSIFYSWLINTAGQQPVRTTTLHPQQQLSTPMVKNKTVHRDFYAKPSLSRCLSIPLANSIYDVVGKHILDMNKHV
ncbi:trypsin alpha-like [Daphnia carinata]|uniref:trypsin alpha-like n=1 Tax=Daphnia carinata TaxID=120202 RepID=UPI00257FDF60|nr:trypsin alpha-like [Daphnia carinata]